MAEETFTALEGSLSVGGTHFAEVRSFRSPWSDLQGIEEVRVFGNKSYLKRTRPESVTEFTCDFVFDSMDLVYQFASPTPNDPQGPVTPVDYTSMNPVTGSFVRLRYASAYPTSVEWTQDRDGHFEGTVTCQCGKEDVIPFYGSPLT